MAMKERTAMSFSGWLALLIGLGSIAGSVVSFVMLKNHQQDPGAYVGGGIGLFLFGVILLAGCMVIGPNDVIFLHVTLVWIVFRYSRCPGVLSHIVADAHVRLPY